MSDKAAASDKPAPDGPKGKSAAVGRPQGVVWRIVVLAILAFSLPMQVQWLPYPDLFAKGGIVLTFLAVVAAFVR